jgi:hypothetical protein
MYIQYFVLLLVPLVLASENTDIHRGDVAPINVVSSWNATSLSSEQAEFLSQLPDGEIHFWKFLSEYVTEDVSDRAAVASLGEVALDAPSKELLTLSLRTRAMSPRVEALRSLAVCI